MTVVEYSGFHFYIEWNGKEGVDQHGSKWVNPEKPEPKYFKSLSKVCEIYKNQTIELTKLMAK